MSFGKVITSVLLLIAIRNFLDIRKYGRALRNLRKVKKLTQDELSLYSRVDRSYISELENGEKAPSLLTITALARALHVKPSALIEDYEREMKLDT